ncbi:MAG TPA: ATP-binding cassette domain-containing protein [Sporichthyaceae bacterium]
MNAHSGAIPHQATGGGAAGVIRAGGTIRVENLVKQYGSTKAVDELSFEVAPGQVTGFLGPNGAGKTTTMRCILGLDAPSSGRVTVGGRAYRDLPAPLREVGALVDAGAVHPKRTAYNHLLALAQSNRIPAGRVDEVLGMVGLESVAGKRVGGFSLGMNQRLGIAAALLGDPPVLMFDEPVNGLDPEGIVWVRKFMQALAAEGRTVFVSSHLMSEMALMAEHVIVIGRGRLLRDQTVAEFVETSSEYHVRVRARDLIALESALTEAGGRVRADEEGGLEVFGLEAAAIGELAASRYIALHELSPQRGSLEEAFMKLTQDSVEYSASVKS